MFYTDNEGYVGARADGPTQSLALWLVDDVGTSLTTALNLLADLADIAAGRKSTEEWDGSAWAATLNRDKVTVRNLFRPALHGTYPFDQVRQVADDYWRFLVSDGSRDKVEALTEWEEWNGHPHPRHAEL